LTAALGSFNNAKCNSYCPCIFCFELILLARAFSERDVATLHLLMPMDLLKSGTSLRTYDTSAFMAN